MLTAPYRLNYSRIGGSVDQAKIKPVDVSNRRDRLDREIFNSLSLIVQ